MRQLPRVALAKFKSRLATGRLYNPSKLVPHTYTQTCTVHKMPSKELDYKVTEQTQRLIKPRLRNSQREKCSDVL